jgi:mono/diheme cytochrome c family protein
VNRRGPFALVVVIALAVCLAWLGAAPVASGPAPRSAGAGKSAGHAHKRGHHHGDHEHPPVPAAYASAHVPDRVWTDPRMIARGREIYTAKCAVCHGANGDGRAPAAASLQRKPADFTDAAMVAEMPGNYWVWRVSEGGLAEPFRSKGSAMPAWKDELSMNDRWAVIAYTHTLSGHRGPHIAREHPELEPRPKFVRGEGTVVALRPDRQQIVVEHGEIKGFMEAMTMGYKVTPVSLLDAVKPGDRVRFTIDTEARAITQLEPLKD